MEGGERVTCVLWWTVHFAALTGGRRAARTNHGWVSSTLPCGAVDPAHVRDTMVSTSFEPFGHGQGGSYMAQWVVKGGITPYVAS